MNKLVQLVSVFSLLSVLAVGGGTAVLPQMKHETVVQHQWLTADQFTNIYSLGQLSPGPNMMMVSVIGYDVAGPAGAVLVLLAFFCPSCLLVFTVERLWEHFGDSPLRTAIQRGMAPITIGLMLGGVYAIGRTATFDLSRPLIFNLTTVLIGVAVTATLLLRHVNPALLILLGGVVGWLFLRV